MILTGIGGLRAINRHSQYFTQTYILICIKTNLVLGLNEDARI
jgi:hypothetical protein